MSKPNELWCQFFACYERPFYSSPENFGPTDIQIFFTQNFMRIFFYAPPNPSKSVDFYRKNYAVKYTVISSGSNYRIFYSVTFPVKVHIFDDFLGFRGGSQMLVFLFKIIS